MKKQLLFIITCLLITGASAQTHQIDIHSNNRVASLLMTSVEYNNWIVNNEFVNFSVREPLFQDIYKKFSDEFDFIFLVLNEDSKPADLPFGQLIQVSNDVSGIGLNIFDNSSNYGSDGKLKAVMHLTSRSFLTLGPSLHELMHNWANFGLTTHAVSSTGNNLNSFAFIPHWGFTGGSSRGQLGGFDQNSIIENGNNSYTVDAFGFNANGGNSIPYNELELYLMGMIPASSVSNFDVFTEITSYSRDGATIDFEASTRTTYTSASLIDSLGERVPSSIESQKEFNALVIVLTDSPLTQDEWNEVDEDAEEFSRKASDGTSRYNFWEATNGIASINMKELNKVVGLNEVNLTTSFKIFPNPVIGNLNIRLVDQNLKVDAVSILNAFGQSVNTVRINVAQNVFSIDMSNYSSGIYFVQFIDQGKVLATKRVIKM